MGEFLWIFSALLMVAGGGYAPYALATRGVKGAMFGDAINATHSEEVVYRHRGVKHTFRLHKLDGGDNYGLEIGRWTGMFGETAAIVAPGEELLKLRDMISAFVDEHGV